MSTIHAHGRIAEPRLLLRSLPAPSSLTLTIALALTALNPAFAGPVAEQPDYEPGAHEHAWDDESLPPPILPGRLDTYLARLAATMEMRGPLVFEPAAKSPDQPVALYARAAPGMLDPLEASIERLGGQAGRVGETILAVRLPARSLPSFARLEELDRAEAALPRRPLLDESIPRIGADRVVRGQDLDRSLTGEGVILGLVDTGLDYEHPTFAGEDGTPRVLAVWDQGSDGEPPPGRDVGRLCERHEILDGTCPSLDIVGHGTHVAATAGGSYPGLSGVAPGVDFVSSGSLTFELLAEAADWIFETADEHGLPAVINMSLGGHFGAHDGSSLEEIALTEMSGPGRIIVVAAGNDGGNRIHLSYPLDDEPGRTDILLYPGFLSEGGFIDLWNEAGGSMEVQLALLDSSDEVVTATGFRAGDDPPFSGPLEDSEGTMMGQAQISFEPAHTDTGKERATVFLMPASEPNTYAGNPSGYRWVLELRGDGTFHGWISSASFGSAPASFGEAGRAGDDKSVVAMPGTAPGVITVAAYSTRNEWLDIDGEPFIDPSITVGDIAFFSSSGPSTDPERTGMKPEIAAPGEFIVAPFGRNALIFDRSTMLDEDIAAMRGTSMAAPHVAGAVALLLEAQPDLDRDEVLELLALSAREDEHTLEVPNDRWGHGKLDAYAAARALVGPEIDDEAKEESGCGCSKSSTNGVAPSAAMLLLALALGSRSVRRRAPSISRSPSRGDPFTA